MNNHVPEARLAVANTTAGNKVFISFRAKMESFPATGFGYPGVPYVFSYTGNQNIVANLFTVYDEYQIRYGADTEFLDDYKAAAIGEWQELGVIIDFS